MIVVRLMGGMGNQMFQYAAARILADKHKTSLLVDTSLCADSESVNASGISLRPYELDVFAIPGQKLEDCYFRRTLWSKKERRVYRAAAWLFYTFCRYFSNSWKMGISERKDVTYDPSLMRLPSNVILKGYFPSYKYFKNSEDVIRRDYTFQVEPDEKNTELITEMSASHSVSLHVRRGDYLSNEKTRDKFGVCSLFYYENAIKSIVKTVTDPRFFIFTNDPGYVKKNLKIDYPVVYVTHNSGKKSYEDMRLMSHCKHNIIANSSFSWWGAWLNRNPNKMIICPEPAFDKMILSDDDFYPPSWVRIPKAE